MPRYTIALLLLATLALAGCSTVETRIREKSAVFSTLDASTQQKIRRSIVELGYTPDMVYIALGVPDSRHTKTTAQGYEETWIYRVYYDEWAGQVLSHYRRVVSYDPVAKQYHVYYVPVYVQLYEERAEETFRVSFHNGRVAAIEQPRETAPPATPPAPKES